MIVKKYRETGTYFQKKATIKGEEESELPENVE
jgi:hypothetical protein